MTATHHPPVGLIPPPPPAPTADDGARWLRNTPPPDAVQDAPSPAAEPAAQPAQQPAAEQQPPAQQTARAERRKPKKQTVYAAIVGVPLAGMLGWAYLANRGDTQPTQPSDIEQLQATVNQLATNVSALAANATTPATAVQTNPLNAMPCAITNDAKRFLGVNEDGTLVLQTSVLVSRQVFDQVQAGADYRDLVVRTGVSITQLEVAQSGPGVALFDCGAPPVVAAPTAPPATTAAPAPVETAPQPGA